MSSLVVGFGLGLFVGAQPGPVSLLCIRSVVRGTVASGVAIGAGAALIDLLCAGLGLAGAASLFDGGPLHVAFGLLGALVLAFIGARTLWAAFTALTLLVASVRGRFGPRMLATVDVVAGSGLLGFAGLLGWRAVHES